MKILISGGSGFIGSHICDYFLKEGAEIWCIDNFLTSNIENIENCLNNKNFVFIEDDICKINVDKLRNNFDYVLHFASPASPVDYNKYPVETLRVNSIGTENMIKISLANNSIFLYSSASEVYGDPEIPVQNEEYWGRVNPIGERSMYDEGKRYGEALIMAYHRKYKLNSRIVRIFNTYGPRMRINDGRVIPNFIVSALTGKPITIYGDGNQTRSFCYISDLIKGIIRIFECNYNLPINIGSCEEFTIKQLAKKVKEIIGSKVEIIYSPPLPDDPKRRKPDITKAKKILKWKPVVTLENGLKETIPYFEKKLKK